MKLIPLNHGLFAKVDDNQFERIAKLGKWIFQQGYAAKSLPEGRFLRMHHLVLAPKDGFLIDHIDGDGFNNQRKNLRYVTRSEHSINTRKRRDNTSGVKGVSWAASSRTWYAQIKRHPIYWHKNFFKFEDAVAQRREWEQQLHGEFRCKNQERPPTFCRTLAQLKKRLRRTAG